MNRSHVLGVAAAVFLITAPAAAAPTVFKAFSYGAVRGRLSFYQANGGYCPSTRDCSGSNYRQSAFHAWAPVSNIRVELRANGRVIGQGSTDFNGRYTISWFSTASKLSNAYVRVVGKHKDNRFVLKTKWGTTPAWYTRAFALDKGSSVSDPQDVGETRFGRADFPDKLLNYYDAAEHTWWYGLMGSSAIYNNWDTVELRGIYAGASELDTDECVGTCGSGEGKYVKIDPSFELSLTTVAHELGHVASYMINPFYSTGDYGYPMQCEFGDPYCNGTHFQTSAEWQHVQFEEGFASFVASVALNQAFAPDPYFCTGNAESFCVGGASRMEPSLGASCSSNERRQENQVTRYLWDYYDTVNDVTPYSDTLSTHYWDIYDSLALFGDCTYNGCDDEQLTLVDRDTYEYDARDGRNAYDFYLKTRYRYGNSSSQYTYNCGYNGNHGRIVVRPF